MNYQIALPIFFPIDASPMFGQIAMDGLNVLGAMVVLAFVVACGVIGWKILNASARRPLEAHLPADRRDLDQAA